MNIFVWVLIVFFIGIIFALVKEFKKTPDELKRDIKKQIWKARGKPLEGTFELPKDSHEIIENSKSHEKDKK